MWHPYLVQKQKHCRRIPLGLKNGGNTCYSNSVFQCLTYAPPLAVSSLTSTHSNLCTHPSKCPVCILESRIRRSLELNAKVDNPSSTNSHLQVWSSEDIVFKFQNLHDPYIFFKRVIDACYHVGGGIDFKKMFTLALPTICIFCRAVSLGNAEKMLGNAEKMLGNAEEMFALTLDIWGSKSISDALDTFLASGKSRKCKQCGQGKFSQMPKIVHPAPSILVLHLKRFQGKAVKEKIISFEEVLHLPSKETYPEYKLFGTIIHKGDSPSEGHYYAYIKDAADSWYRCDDSSVTPSTFEEVKKENVYILFFSSTKRSEKNEKRSLKYQSIDLATDVVSSKLPNIKKELHEKALSNLKNSHWFKNVCELMRSKMARANNVNKELLTDADKLAFWEQALDQVENSLVEHIKSSIKGNAEPSKKRPADSATKTPAPDKKAKFVIPPKDGKKGVVHVDTPHPTKQAGKSKTPGNKPN